jgi:hypothetical protein
MDGLEKQFDAAMMNIYVRAKNEAGYTASIFHQMLVKRRGRATAKALINAPAEPIPGADNPGSKTDFSV